MEVAASIVGLLAASVQVAGMLKLFIYSVKNALATAEQLYNEINRFRFILRRIQDKTISSDANYLSPERATLIDVNLLGATLTAAVSHSPN